MLKKTREVQMKQVLLRMVRKSAETRRVVLQLKCD
jgi:hypothetical protein